MAGILASLAIPLLGKLFGGEDGIKSVKKTGVYVLHKGEMVVPKHKVKKVPKSVSKGIPSKPKPTKVTKAMVKASMVKMPKK